MINRFLSDDPTALLSAPIGEGFPPSLVAQRKRFREIRRAIEISERSLRRYFQSFAKIIANYAPTLALPFALDEFDDSVERVLGPEIIRTESELALVLDATLRTVVTLGADHAQLEPVLAGIDLAFDVDQVEVQRWLRSTRLELIKGINETTRREIASVLRRGQSEGWSMAQMAKGVEARARGMSARRARLIAQTESIRAYSKGALFAYEASGIVEGKRWIDGQVRACAYCSALHGRVVPLREQFAGGPFGGVEGPPLHPGCRCSIAPELSND